MGERAKGQRLNMRATLRSPIHATRCYAVTPPSRFKVERSRRLSSGEGSSGPPPPGQLLYLRVTTRQDAKGSLKITTLRGRFRTRVRAYQGCDKRRCATLHTITVTIHGTHGTQWPHRCDAIRDVPSMRMRWRAVAFRAARGGPGTARVPSDGRGETLRRLSM